MNHDQIQALKDKHAAELEAMDAKAEKLDALRSAQYHEARNNFTGLLDSLEDATEEQFEEISANIEKGWDGIRSWWHGIGDDNESVEEGNLLDDIDDTKAHN